MSEGALVLNVNDDEATRYLYSKILQRGGYRVVEAANGLAALEIVQRERPDLVLLDVKLPDISGLEVCRRIKGDPKTSTMLVVQTSATFSSADRKVQGLDSGADAYLAQPIESVELLASVRALLRRQSAEEAERRIARKLQKTFDAIRDPLVIVDTEGCVRQHNPSALELFEAGAEPPLGRHLADVLHHIVPRETMRKLLARDDGRRREIEVTAGERCFSLSVDPIAADQDGGEGAVVMLADITDRYRLEEQHRRRAEELALESRRKDEFLGMLAHELRNPLNAISAANTVLDRTGPHDAASVRLRTIISRQTRHLARMVDDLLEVSRVTRGKIELRKQPVDLVQVIRHAVQGSQTSIEARKQRIELSLPDAPVMIDGDDLRLEQIATNLIGNASKYSEPNRVIGVSVVEPPDGRPGAMLRVTDEGVGIPAEMLEAVFEPFVQVDPPLARSLGGLGIGLSMVKSLVEMHGGSVLAKSDGLGKGTEVVVELPVVDRPAAPAKPAQAEPLPNNGLKILVVEDNADTRELLETWLGMLGHEVETAPDGRAGLELIARIQPDLAFLDIGLPEMDGYEVAKNLRADGHATYLVALTGYGRPEDRARALDAGFDDYIVKPLDQHSLEKVLRRPRSSTNDARSAAD